MATGTDTQTEEPRQLRREKRKKQKRIINKPTTKSFTAHAHAEDTKKNQEKTEMNEYVKPSDQAAGATSLSRVLQLNKKITNKVSGQKRLPHSLTVKVGGGARQNNTDRNVHTLSGLKWKKKRENLGRVSADPVEDQKCLCSRESVCASDKR